MRKVKQTDEAIGALVHFRIFPDSDRPGFECSHAATARCLDVRPEPDALERPRHRPTASGLRTDRGRDLLDRRGHVLAVASG
jgi:hypothetical protein